MTLTEQVFRKMGWEHQYCDADMGTGTYRWTPSGTWEPQKELPPISSQWEVTAKYLVPFMRERGFYFSIPHEVIPAAIRGGKHQASPTDNFEKTFACWSSTNGGEWDGNPLQIRIEIKDDNIAEAACKAFMEVSLDARGS